MNLAKRLINPLVSASKQHHAASTELHHCFIALYRQGKLFQQRVQTCRAKTMEHTDIYTVAKTAEPWIATRDNTFRIADEYF